MITQHFNNTNQKAKPVGMTVNFSSNCKKGATPFFCKQSVFDPCPENCLSFSEKLPQEIV